MGNINAVKIIHNIVSRIDYVYLAEFFRFLGVFVCEEILTEDRDDGNSTQFDMQIFIGDQKLNQKSAAELGCTAEEYEALVKELSENTIFLYTDILPGTGMGGQLTMQQWQAAYGLLVNSDKVAEWNQLINVFWQFNLGFHSMNMQYYARKSSAIIMEAVESFLSAYEQIEKISWGQQAGERHFDYAKLWCAMKVNTACKDLDKMLYFPIEELTEECRKICQKYPEFSNAKVLLGMCYEPDVGSAKEAMRAFRDALADIDGKCYSSPVYYWIGKRYESFRERAKEAENSYKTANNRKEKFRNYYKLGIYARNREEYEEAIHLFGMILNKLHTKLRMGYADPLELEYAFKTYFQQCYIYDKMQNYQKVIENGKLAESVRGKLIDGNKYMQDFYGGMCKEKYADELKKRMGMEQVYWLMSGAYRKLFDEEKAELYRTLALECKGGIPIIHF